MVAKSQRPARNVSSEDFVREILRQADLENGCITNLADELGLTVNSAYARYAKYRKEMKAETGVVLPKLSKCAERKATLNWAALAAMVNAPDAPDDVDADNVDADETDDMLPPYDMTQGEVDADVAEMAEIQA